MESAPCVQPHHVRTNDADYHMLLAVRGRRKVEEAGDRLEATVGDHPDVEAPGQCDVTIRTKLPGEAHPVVVCVDIARAAEAIPRKLGLNALDHGVDAVSPLTSHKWVEVLRFLRPGAPDQLAALGGIGLVPGRDVAVNHLLHLTHDDSFSLKLVRRAAFRPGCHHRGEQMAARRLPGRSLSRSAERPMFRMSEVVAVRRLPEWTSLSSAKRRGGSTPPLRSRSVDSRS